MKNFTLLIITLGLISSTYTACSAEAYGNMMADNTGFSSNTQVTMQADACTTTALDSYDEAGVCGAYLMSNNVDLCCNQDSLATYITEFRTQAKTYFTARKTGLQASVALLASGLDKFIARLENVVFRNALQVSLSAYVNVASSIRIDSPFVGFGTQLKVSGSASATFWADILAEFKGYTQTPSVAATFEAAIAKAKNCRIEYNKARVGAICIRASTAGSDFMATANEGYKVNPSTCTTLVKNCAEVMTAAAISQRVSVVLSLLKKIRLGENDDDGKAFAAVSAATITEMSTCSDDAEACSSNTSKRQAMCEHFTLDMANISIEGSAEANAEAAIESQIDTTLIGGVEKGGNRRNRILNGSGPDGHAGQCKETGSGKDAYVAAEGSGEVFEAREFIQLAKLGLVFLVAFALF